MRVKLIKRDSGASLVEYESETGVRRVVVPSSALDNDECADDILQAGIEYGEDWKAFIGELSVDGALRKLESSGIWTWDDLAKNPGAIRQALHATVEDNIRAVLRELSLRVEN